VNGKDMFTMTEIETLREEMASLRAQMRKLADVAEITQLVAQYGPTVDSGAAKATASLWTEDGVFAVVGGETSFSMNGRGDIVAMVDGGHQSLIAAGAAHVLTTPHVVVDGDTATGRSHALNIRWDPAADRFWVARVSANCWTFARTSEGWKITERINSNLDGAERSRAILAPRPISN
jgi:ketosteroid isomerase-like protein